MMATCCKTCKYWDRDTAKDKSGRIRSDRGAPCLFPVPDLPDSFMYYVSKNDMDLRWMAAGDGQKCKTHLIYIKGDQS